MRYFFQFFVLVCFPIYSSAQDALKTWDNNQKDISHLRARYSKRSSFMTDSTHLFPVKIGEKYFKKGKLEYETAFNADGNLLYQMQFVHEGNSTTATNLLDSSVVRYQFPDTDKLRFYVAEGKSQYHLIYTYDSLNRIIRCKDCLSPFNTPDYCAVYTYEYEGKALTGTKTFTLPTQAPIQNKVYYSKDSIILDNKQRRSYCKSYDNEQQLQRVIHYNYKWNKLKSIKSTYPDSERQKVITLYYKWGKLHKKSIAYYERPGILNRKYLSYYNRKGDEIKRNIQNKSGRTIKQYTIKYTY